jgi:outer membrane receptor protein involved in Fe transport
MIKHFLLASCFLNAVFCNAQSVSGIIKSRDSEIIAEASVVCSNNQSAISNSFGYYQLALKPGAYKLKIQAISFQTKVVDIQIEENKNTTVDISLEVRTKELKVVTISGSRFAKRAAEEVVSIEVLKPNFIRNAAINTADEALNKLPGVDVIDNQINIRGGSGWSYGAGSRVMVLLNDIPMLTADASDAKWDFMPLENCEQIEVLKGAASSLYGSSALNGVVNFRTAYAKNKPITKLQIFNGVYGNPNRKEMIWWGKKQPMFQGGYLSHAQKLDNLDFVVGSAWYAEDSYLQGDATRRVRLNTNLRYTNKKIKGLSYGVHTNLQLGKSSSFFLHEADSSLVNLLKPFGGLADSTTSLNKNQGRRFNIDPYLNYSSHKGVNYSLRTRIFNSNNFIPEKKQSSNATSYYADAQVSKKFQADKGWLKDLNAISGLVYNYNTIVGDLYGSHTTNNIAPYLQLEKKIGPVWLATGVRLENNSTDGTAKESKPVYRAGANYAISKTTNIRANWGQGYRYATVAEKFVATNFGAASVFPNSNLKSETGNSKEIGIKQGLSLGKWLGFADLALFQMKYQNMMEFNFGYNPPIDSPIVANPLKYIGFQSRNIGDTKISGLDFSLMGQNNAGKVSQNIMAGYTFILPVSSNPDSSIMANFSTDRNILKYRYQHSVKLSWEGIYKKWGLGFINTMNSKMVNIDEVFENSKPAVNVFGLIFQAGTQLPSTISKYRNIYNKPIWLADIRLSYQINTNIKAAFIIKNIWNTEYYERPALINAPRNFTLQLSADL